MYETNKIYLELTEIVINLFDLDETQISTKFGTDDSEKWDSIGHLKLVAAIEERFQIELTPAEQTEMLTIGLIIDIVSEKIRSVEEGETSK